MTGDFAKVQSDKAKLQRLTETTRPNSFDKVELGCLMMRYQGTALHKDVDVVVEAWGTTPQQLFHECKQIWAHGFKIEKHQESGSSWDSRPGE